MLDVHELWGGWFFDDLSGIENGSGDSVAGRGTATGGSVVPEDFGTRSQSAGAARSNLPNTGMGIHYERYVQASDGRSTEVGAHYAGQFPVENTDKHADLLFTTSHGMEYRSSRQGKVRVVWGRPA